VRFFFADEDGYALSLLMASYRSRKMQQQKPVVTGGFEACIRRREEAELS
jgi:hypothetical protein